MYGPVRFICNRSLSKRGYFIHNLRAHARHLSPCSCLKRVLKSVAELWAGEHEAGEHVEICSRTVSRWRWWQHTLASGNDLQLCGCHKTMISSCVVVTKLWSLAVWLSQNDDLQLCGCHKTMISSCVAITKLWSPAVWLSQNYDLQLCGYHKTMISSCVAITKTISPLLTVSTVTKKVTCKIPNMATKDG